MEFVRPRRFRRARGDAEELWNDPESRAGHRLGTASGFVVKGEGMLGSHVKRIFGEIF